jgi:hypothetical protein
MEPTLDDPAAEAAPVPPLRGNRDFRLLWLGAGASQFGGRLSSIAYPLLMV